jgi:hypothetical protein
LKLLIRLAVIEGPKPLESWRDGLRVCEYVLMVRGGLPSGRRIDIIKVGRMGANWT